MTSKKWKPPGYRSIASTSTEEQNASPAHARPPRAMVSALDVLRRAPGGTILCRATVRTIFRKTRQVADYSGATATGTPPHESPVGERATAGDRSRYLLVPAAADLRLAARVFLLLIPHVDPDVAERCLERAAQLLELTGPDGIASPN